MFLTERKLQSRIDELADHRYRDVQPVAAFGAKEDEEALIGAYPPEAIDDFSMKIGDLWRGRDRYVWLQAKLSIPAAWAGRKALGRFDFGNTGAGNNDGFESLCFYNNVPYQGVDSNHKEVFLPADAAGQDISLTFRLWSGLEGGGKRREQCHEIKMAQICWLDEAADDLYYTAKATLETVQVLQEKDPYRAELLKGLNTAFNKIDWTVPGSESFYESLTQARDSLAQAISAIEHHFPVTLHCVGHTHIDVAWLWRLKHTREKCARSFTTVMRLMEMFPEYTFLQTQPQLYDYVQEDYPELYEQIKERAREGKWEADGAMWLEADCNLTSGESLVRQLLFGKRFFQQQFGTDCKYLWLPDVFGYSWALPQILKKSGIDTFMTTKISWNQFNRMPHDTFKWRGIDGSEVLTHFVTTPEPWNGPDSWFYTYNGYITAKTLKGAWDGYRDKEINKELLVSYGYGDGGGGVNRDMLEMRRRFENMPGLPKVTTGKAGDFFAKLQDTVEQTPHYVHTWDGELYLEFHRGTYTSQAYNKLMNRKLELKYREVEWLNVLQNALQGKGWADDHQAKLNQGWKIILRNQFHDIIPGSSIREVYEDCVVEYAEAESIAVEAYNQVMDELAMPASDSDSKGETYTVWNASPWNSTDLVHISTPDGPSDGVWSDAQGRPLMAQKVADGWLVKSEEVPSLGYTTIQFSGGTGASASEQASKTFEFLPSGLLTPFYELEWNKSGQLTRIYDREADREVLAKGARGNVLQLFEDKPLMFDAWDIDIFYQEKMREITNCERIEVVEHGELRTVIRFVWKQHLSEFVQDMIVYRDDRRIDFRTKVEWRERNQLLKVAFPVAVRATEATYDIQFGNVKRPTHWNTSWDFARFESVGHQWADLSDKGYGVSLMNDCKYGYDIKDNVLRLSLLKSAMHPDTEADQGHHAFTYSLYPHQGDWLQGDTVRRAWALNQPLQSTSGRVDRPEMSLFKLNTDKVMIDAVKKAEDSDAIVVRLHDYSGMRSHLNMTSDLDIVSWQACDLMERPIGDVVAGDTVSVAIEPYEIQTFLIHLS